MIPRHWPKVKEMMNAHAIPAALFLLLVLFCAPARSNAQAPPERTSQADEQTLVKPVAPASKFTSRQSYHFNKKMSRPVLESYLSRAISMEGLLNGRGDLADNIRMLKSIGAKFIGRSLCLWGNEANLLSNFDRARRQIPLVHAADPDMVLQACIFEIVTTQVEQVPIPPWAFK